MSALISYGDQLSSLAKRVGDFNWPSSRVQMQGNKINNLNIDVIDLKILRFNESVSPVMAMDVSELNLWSETV